MADELHPREVVDHMADESKRLGRAMREAAAALLLTRRNRDRDEAERRVVVTKERVRQEKERASSEFRRERAERAAERDRLFKEKMQRGLQAAGRYSQMTERSVHEHDRTLERERLGREQADVGMMAAGLATEHAVMERERGDEATPGMMGRPAMEFDSPERRMALALELAELGVAPELIEVRMLSEMAQGRPLIDAAREPIVNTPRVTPVREVNEGRERHRER